MFKLENGVLIQNQQTIQFVKDGYFYSYTNPSEEILKELGWKPIKELEPYPENIGENETVEVSYEETEDEIITKYEIVERPQEQAE